MVYLWSDAHPEIQHKFHWEQVWDDRAHKEVHVTTSNTYVLSSQSSLTGDKNAPDVGDEQQLSGVSPEEVARAAVERANRKREAVIVTASHWPKEPMGSGWKNRLSAVKVCPDDSVDDVAEEIGELEGPTLAPRRTPEL